MSQKLLDAIWMSLRCLSWLTFRGRSRDRLLIRFRLPPTRIIRPREVSLACVG